ncbi:hypothetical protein ACE1YR_05430 [Pseudomonas sp. K1(2024)]|uniref:DUF6916 domain-containing protein n=2 Tax=Pseudomonas TaxID=286 RepID=A0AAI8KE19_9PSED|nr:MULTISPECIES: hypothetical protein [Pseudomonas]AXO89856.1 hypothetical protein DZC75_18275 [Pseudomonas parafulva]MDO7903498.1 hypothetical protein [Pseudomonas sp. K13]
MNAPVHDAIPSRQELLDADPEGFVLQIAHDHGLRVSLLEVREGIAMNEHYECYSLVLALPHGVVLPQAVFNLYGPGRAQPWALLMSPMRPEADGRHVLEAVIHRDRVAVADAP